MPSDLRPPIQSSLQAFADTPLRNAARDLFATLGYQSDRTHDFGSVENFIKTYDSSASLLGRFDPASNWQEVRLIFQLTSTDIAQGPIIQPEFQLGDPADLSDRAIESYLFIALELRPAADGKFRTRTDLCDLARAINRLFPMPALVLFKEGDKLSIAITYRRVNKKDRSKDVVERKVTLIKDISIARPHPGHLAIIEDFSLPSLSEFRKKEIKTFIDLDNAWRESLSVELLRKRAYRMLADWYFWAREHTVFPPDALPDADGKPSLHLIRLLTRVIFCWFVKEKTLPDGRPLIPYHLFDAPRIREILKDASPDAATYYTGVLQNLFFATLNTEMDPKDGEPNRRFARKVTSDHMVHTLWRHREQLRDPDDFADNLRYVPFLNGGLFECLDDRVEKSPGSTETREVRVDGFSTNLDKAPRLPNFLFFGGERTVDLSEATGNSQRAAVKVIPLLDILNSFVWTITENTPIEEEVALDPDLLGNVFENLLAAYNPETGTIARNATGSFYTPDYTVDWMIDQALEPLLLKALPSQSKKNAARIRRLLDWDEPGHDFNDSEATLLVDALSRLRALDPACGSGAFPMGLLKKMVRVLAKLDPGNRLWKARQIALAEQIDSAPAREDALVAIGRAFTRDNDDYGRKLYLIENSIYGVDIQPLAVQIAKLRFFITLVVDQPIDPTQPNYGILPLPNLETKIVAANTLLRIDGGPQRELDLFSNDEIRRLEGELKAVRHRYFTARRYRDKKALRQRDRELCRQLAKALTDSHECTPADAERLSTWNPYNTNVAAGFFDPGWMFGLEGEGGKFDLVLGNPPYVRQEALKSTEVLDSTGKKRPLKEVLKGQYECFTGTADLYVYFFERSLQLLRVGGILSFITSNKYFRAAYGEKLRAYLLHSTAPRAILDFGDTNIFTAVAYPCILVTEKVRDVGKGELPDPKLFELESKFADHAPHADRDIPVLAWKPGPSKVEFPAIFDREAIPLSQKDLKPSGWRLESPVGMRLLDRLRKSGKSLGEYCQGRWYWGVKTGLNEAFVVDRATRDRLVAEHPGSAEVLNPFLRGRDVKRWRCEFAEQYLIKIESSENVTHPWTGNDPKTAEAIFAKELPSVHAWFNEEDQREKLIKRYDQGHYFWELRSCAYWQEFEHPKIVIPAISATVNIAVDFERYYANNKASIFVPDDPLFVAAILNSPVSFWVATQLFASKQSGFWDFEPRYSTQWPIPSATPAQKSICEQLTGALIDLHKPEPTGLPERGLMVAYLEQWLNGLVYELFFPAELHARHLHLFDESAKPENRIPDLSGLEPTARFDRLKACFQRVYDIKHPIREMLFSLRSIEEIRIIEGES